MQNKAMYPLYFLLQDKHVSKNYHYYHIFWGKITSTSFYLAEQAEVNQYENFFLSILA